MVNSISTFFSKQWRRLSTASSSRRLSWFALILVFAIDGYVLSLLFDGMERAGRVVEVPYQRMTRICVDLSVRYLQDDADDRLHSIEWFADSVRNNRANSIREYDGPVSDQHPLCQQVWDRLLLTVSDPTLGAMLEERARQLKAMEQVKEEIAQLKNTYGDALLEKIANQKRSDSILPVEADKIKQALDQLNARRAALEQSRLEQRKAIEQHPAMIAYLAYLRALPLDAEYEKDQQHLSRMQFWYPVKVLASQIAFLLPLLLLAISWNRRALDRQYDSQIMISAHLILVCAVPVLLRLLQFLRELLPESLFSWLLYQLDRWHLSFVWYYLMIFGSVAGGLILIVIAQRTLFTAARQRLTRLRKALCRHCGEKLRSSEQTWCEVCGAEQSAPCGHCGHPRRLLAFHCSHCGTSQPAPQ